MKGLVKCIIAEWQLFEKRVYPEILVELKEQARLREIERKFDSKLRKIYEKTY